VAWTQNHNLPLSRESYGEIADEVENDRRRQVLEIGSLAMFAVAAVTAVRMWTLDLTSQVIALGITVVACSLNLVWSRLGGPVDRIGNLSVAIFYGLILNNILSTGGYYDTHFNWICAVPLGAALLVSLRSSCYWAVIVGVTTVCFWYVSGSGIEIPNLIPIEERHDQALFNRLMFIAGVTLLSMSFSITQRRTERSLAERNRALRLEAQCVQLLQHAAIAANESDDFDVAIDTCVDRVMQTTGWKVGLVWEPIAEGSDEWGLLDRVHAAEGCDVTELIDRSRAYKVEPGVQALGRVRSTSTPEWAAGQDLEMDPSPRAQAAIAVGLHSAVAIPVAVRGTVLRIIEFFGPEANEPEARLIDVLCDVGQQLGRVAQRVQLQASVRQSQKLESVGQLAAGIAHEINNPMAYVRANLGMLQQDWKEIHDLAKLEIGSERIQSQLQDCDELIAESLDGVDRTISIVRDMREFARDGGGSPERVAIEELVEGSLRVASSAKPMGASIETRLEPGLEIECMTTRMRQVVLNLVMNAFQAIEQNGHLRITSRSQDDRVLITIEDDGHGIEERDREHIFDPFYTTKPVGQGTGLGLYISFEIVRWHGGTIDVESNPGMGSKFTIELPALNSEEEG
jgi:signal transduction histidine kinase